jgi:hypothetical protein
MKDYIATIIKNEQIADNIFAVTFDLGEEAVVRAGQFGNISVGENNLLRRPIAICKAQGSEVTFCYQIKGEGTKKLKAMQVGAKVNVLMPLGNGFFIEEKFPTLTQKTQVILECMREEVLAEIEYQPIDEEKILSKIEPHSLVLKQGVWYLYAFCHLRRDFYLFTVGRISGIVKTNEIFRKRNFAWTDIPLQPQAKKHLTARLEVADNALEEICDKLGVENLTSIQGKWIAEISLPEDTAEQTILSFGVGVKVLSPDSLREKVLSLAKNILKNNL